MYIYSLGEWEDVSSFFFSRILNEEKEEGGAALVLRIRIRAFWSDPEHEPAFERDWTGKTNQNIFNFCKASIIITIGKSIIVQ